MRAGASQPVFAAFNLILQLHDQDFDRDFGHAVLVESVMLFFSGNGAADGRDVMLQRLDRWRLFLQRLHLREQPCQRLFGQPQIGLLFGRLLLRCVQIELSCGE